MTPIFGTFPTATPGVLGTGVAPLIASSKAELLITLASTVNGYIDGYLLRWDGSGAWYPVSPRLQVGVQLQSPPQSLYPAESLRRSDPALAGRNRFVFDVEGPQYYCLFFPTAAASDVSSAALNELWPQSGAFSAGSQVRGSLPTYAAPVAANNAGVAAAVAANAANDFVGPFGAIEAWGRTLRVVFAASWDGGDVIVTGTDQFGQAVSETFASAPSSTVQGVKVFRTVTAIRKTVVGATANTASVGIGTGLGVPFTFSRGQEFLNGVAELATLGTTYYSFIPGTAANGARNYDFIGW